MGGREAPRSASTESRDTATPALKCQSGRKGPGKTTAFRPVTSPEGTTDVVERSIVEPGRIAAHDAGAFDSSSPANRRKPFSSVRGSSNLCYAMPDGGDDEF